MTAALTIQRIDAGHARVAGALGFAEAAGSFGRWRDFVAGASSGAANAEVAVDLSALECVDSATLAILLSWAAHAREVGVRLRYTAVPAGLAALAKLCDTEALLGIA